MDVLTLTSSQIQWPGELDERLQKLAPSRLWIIGNPEILAMRKIGLFSSVSCPQNTVADAYNVVRKLCEKGLAMVSGFHSPVEKECLQILLQEKQPVVICPARALRKMRLSGEWQSALDDGRLLLLSRFEKSRRADKETARRRNELVAALSDEVLIIHAEPGGHIEQISELASRWNIPMRKLD